MTIVCHMQYPARSLLPIDIYIFSFYLLGIMWWIHYPILSTVCKVHVEISATSMIINTHQTVQKKTFNNLSELDTKTSAMLIHSIRNWFHTLLTKDAAYKIVGNFLFPANQFRNNPNPYVTGFTLQFFVHNKHTIRFHVHVERRKLSTLTPQDVMRRVIDNEIMGMWRVITVVVVESILTLWWSIYTGERYTRKDYFIRGCFSNQ